jgi:hypothetical protein
MLVDSITPTDRRVQNKRKRHSIVTPNFTSHSASSSPALIPNLHHCSSTFFSNTTCLLLQPIDSLFIYQALRPSLLTHARSPPQQARRCLLRTRKRTTRIDHTSKTATDAILPAMGRRGTRRHYARHTPMACDSRPHTRRIDGPFSRLGGVVTVALAIQAIAGKRVAVGC